MPELEIEMTWIEPGNPCPSGLMFACNGLEGVFVCRAKDLDVVAYIRQAHDNDKFKGGDVVKGPWLLVRALRNGRVLDFGKERTLPARYALAGDYEGGYQRHVWQFAGPESGLPIRAGLTAHTTRGSWSSWPPHGFEAEGVLQPAPPLFVEKFAYLTEPRGGWGLQTMVAEWAINGAGVPVRDGDILPIPLSSHPVVAGPGYKLAYFWAYMGDPTPEKFGEKGRT